MSKINPFNNKNKLINKNDIQNILKKYNIFQNINSLAIYQQAFVHKSYEKQNLEENVLKDRDLVLSEKLDGVVDLQPKSYETLEFLGDAIIELVITAYLFERYNNQNEHFLSKLRIALVKGTTLAFLSKVIGLNKFLLISKTLEEKENARQKDSILEDIFEAFIGALYLDSGDYKLLEKFIISVIHNFVDISELIQNDNNYKDQILRYFQKNFSIQPKYETSKRDEQNDFISFIDLPNGEIKIQGLGNTKKRAEQDVARNTLIHYRVVSQ